jgi:hypothetical protein
MQGSARIAPGADIVSPVVELPEGWPPAPR